MRKLINIVENAQDVFTFYHAGKGLEGNYTDMQPSANGKWSYGPGIYLANTIELASRYHRDGMLIYGVTVQLTKGHDMRRVTISTTDIEEFVSRYCKEDERDSVMSIVSDDAHSRGRPVASAETLVFACSGMDALSPENTVELRKFIVRHGAKYTVKRMAFSNDYVVVVIDPKIILNIEQATSSDRVEIPHDYIS